MQVRWSAAASADMDGLARYISIDNPAAAVAVVTDIRARADGLDEFPEMGRRGRLRGTRELVVTGSPYLLIYRVETEMVRILRVLHGAQRWPPA